MGNSRATKGWAGRLAAVVAAAAMSAQLQADPRFDSADPAKAPLSVPLGQLQARINGDPGASGAEYAFEVSGRVLRMDLVAMPGKESIAAVVRAIFMVGRLAAAEYDELRLTDAGRDVFVIDGEVLRGIGREFIWGEEGKGQNPIHSVRLLADALRYPDGTRVAEPFNGSLLGDTTKAMNAMNDHLHPKWTLATTRLK